MYVLNDYVVPKIAFFGFTCPLSVWKIYIAVQFKTFSVGTSLDDTITCIQGAGIYSSLVTAWNT